MYTPPQAPFYLRPTNGLCNRLRVLCSYYRLGGDFDVSWVIDNQCTSNFLELFEPIPNCVFREGVWPVFFDYAGSDAHLELKPDYSVLKPIFEIPIQNVI